MARLKTFSTWANKPSGGNLAIKGDINVDVDGNFYFKLEKEYLPFATSYLKETPQERVPDVFISGRNHNNLTARTLKTLEHTLNMICRRMAHSGLKRELVILYKIHSDTCYYRYDDGRIEPNARDDEDYHSSTKKSQGTWHGNLHATERRESYSVNVYAETYCKVTQEGSTTIKYERPFDHPALKDLSHLSDDHEYGALVRLESFMLKKPDDFIEIPYTHKRAQFFYELLMAMCKLSHKFLALEDQDNVLRLADNGKFLLTDMTGEKNVARN